MSVLEQNKFYDNNCHPSVSNRNRILATVLGIAVLGNLSTTLIYFGQIYNLEDILQFRRFSTTERLMNGITAFTDTLIATVLIYLLLKHRSGFIKTNSVINRLIVYAIGTGLITCVWATIGLIGSFALPNTLLYLLVDVTFAKGKFLKKLYVKETHFLL